MKNDPLDQARRLILSLSNPETAQIKIDSFKSVAPHELNKKLEEYYNTASQLASEGNTEEISIMLRVFEHFGDTSHDRMLLHYIAQAEANKGLQEAQTEQKPHHEDMVKALQLISDAFKDANEINTEVGTK